MARIFLDCRRHPTVRVEKRTTRSVTFSKRRQGLIKKASELVTLCGAEVMILTFSPGGKAFSFSHPSPDAIMKRFVGEEPPEQATDTTRDLVEAHRSLQQIQINFHLTQLNDLIIAEELKGKEINRIRRETEGNVLWERPVDAFNERSTLEFLLLKFRQFKDSVDEEVRLLLQGRESKGCVPIPSSVMGGGTYVGPMPDPKGKGLANGPPSSWAVPYDPMAGGSSVWAPIDPMIHGFNTGVSYAPMLAGSSSQTPLDPTAFGSSVPFDPMIYGSSIRDPLHSRINGFDVGARPYVFLAGSSSQTAPYPTHPPPFGEMAVGSSSQVQQDLRTLGLYRGQQFDPMEAETGKVVPSDQIWMGTTRGTYMPFDSNALGPSTNDAGPGTNDGGDNWSFF